MQQRTIFPRKSRRDANETSRPSPAIRAARSFLFPKSYNKNAVVLFSNPRRGMSWTLSDSFCVANLRAFFNVSSRHFFLPSSAFQKRALFPRVYSFEEEERKREMTFDPRTRRTGNVLIASCLFCFASGVYYYAATGGRGFSFGINNASSSSSRLDDDVQRAVDARERKKTRDATEEDTTKRRRRRHARREEEEEEEEAKGRHRRFFWQKKKQ